MTGLLDTGRASSGGSSSTSIESMTRRESYAMSDLIRAATQQYNSKRNSAGKFSFQDQVEKCSSTPAARKSAMMGSFDMLGLDDLDLSKSPQQQQVPQEDENYVECNPNEMVWCRITSQPTLQAVAAKRFQRGNNHHQRSNRFASFLEARVSTFKHNIETITDMITSSSHHLSATKDW